MAEQFIQLPTDAANTGKKVRVNERTVGANTVEEHFTIIQDYTKDFQAQVLSGAPSINLGTGLLVWAQPVGSYATYRTDIGSIRIAEQGLNLQVYNSGLFTVVGSITSMPVSATGSTVLSGISSITGSVSLIGVGSVRLAEMANGLTFQVYNSGAFAIVGSLSSIPCRLY